MTNFINPVVKRSAGLDVHKKSITATILIEKENGNVREETKEFGTFPRQCKQLAKWLKNNQIELVVMESTGIYWKSIYNVLEQHDINAYVVNARHVKKVPGRKTDVQDSQWLATLARYGLLRNSFIPKRDLRELRLVARYRTKLKNNLASEKNRLHKLLDDGGIRLGNIVTNINGVTAQGIIQGLIEGKNIKELLCCIKGSLKNKENDFKLVLEGKLSERHLFTLQKIKNHIDYLTKEITSLDDYIFKAMDSYKEYWQILQTMPGIDAISAALLIIEVGTDMRRFGNKKQFCAWAGMCPGNNESAGKRKSGAIVKGSTQLRQVLCEASNAAAKTNSQFKSKYKSLVIRRGHKKAIIALGHKMLRITYSLVKNKKYYHDPEIDYEALIAKKNAPRWIKTLKQYGYITA